MKRRRNDCLLILGILVLSVAVGLFVKTTEKPGAVAVVTLAGETVARLPLDVSTQVEIGSGNTLCIEDGAAYMLWADCPDKICVRRGRISRDGESILCLPHRVVVTIEGGKTAPVDAVSG